MAQHLFVLYVGCHQEGVYALSHVASLFRLYHVPFREVLLQLLEVFFVEQLDALYIVLQGLQILTNRFRLFLQGQNVILKLLLILILEVLSFNEAIHCVFSLHILKPFLFSLNL